MQTCVDLARPSALLRPRIARAIANIHHSSTYEERVRSTPTQMPTRPPAPPLDEHRIRRAESEG
jgi:hypothetical protein